MPPPAASPVASPQPWVAPARSGLAALPPPPAPTVDHTRFVDGGDVLVDRPYRTFQWRLVRKAWNWHLVGMVVAGLSLGRFGPLALAYPIAALTLWQRSSRQTVGRRLVWATLATLGAVTVVGLPAFIVFSRRWYWIYRNDVPPEWLGVGTRRRGAVRGYFAALGALGARIADALTRQRYQPAVASPTLPEPWGALVLEAERNRQRVRTALDRTSGPAQAPVAAAVEEADRALAAVAGAAERGAAIDAVRLGIDIADVEDRMAKLQPGLGDHDVDHTLDSLRAQLASRARMDERVAQIGRRVQRAVAQMGAAAAQAEELSVYQPAELDDAGHELTSAVDGLTAMRHALEEVE